MAEIAVNLVIDKLIPLLLDEVNLLRNVKSQLVSLKDQLSLTRAYLKEADRKAEMTKASDLEKEWVTKMRRISYQIEDAIDEYLLQVGEAQSWRQVDNKLLDMCGVVRVVRRNFELLKTVKPRHEISSKVGEIEKSFEDILKSFEKLPMFKESSSYGGATAQIPTLHPLRKDALHIEDDKLVGVDHTKQVLSSWLREEPSARIVIAVVGDGGQGKTTIVKKVFDEQEKEKSFDCYAWITVSQLLRGEQLLKSLLERFYVETVKKDDVRDISEVDNYTLVNKLKEHLQGRSYMIVFDDVWDIRFWGDVEHALPNDIMGRIIITTRNRDVAKYCESCEPTTHIHDMEPLNRDDAWNLFCLKAFRKGCPEDLKPLSKDFVKKCNGVPLAIVAMARLLSTKDNVSEWQRVYNSLHSKLSSDPHLSSIYQVLSESYQDLDYHLKPCLLYFGLFPEGYSISRGRLIKLWIAEGFIESKENDPQTLEEVAEEYLDELIARSLVKVAYVNSLGRVKRCRVHDLMHDFILRKCEELNFCQVMKSEQLKFHEWTRRLSIDTSIDDVTIKRGIANYGQVRSCFLFNDVEGMPRPVVESLFSSFKLLVRLDCQGTPLDYLPESVGKLFHLKYLNLRETKIKIIPKSIGKLQNLETLNLEDTDVQELPLEVYRHTKLRCLLVPCMKFKDGIGKLMALQKLGEVDVSVNGEGILSELKDLKQMRVLYIVGLNRENGKLLCSVIESMTNLRSLVVKAGGLGEVLDLESLTRPPQHLQRLNLCGHLQKLPEWILPRLKNLTVLFLDKSKLREDPLPLLKSLSALLELRLGGSSYEGNELYFREGWFMKLKVLTIYLPELKTLKIDGGAMPHLQKLNLSALHPQTMEVPAHIQNVTSPGILYYYEKYQSYNKVHYYTAFSDENPSACVIS